MSHRKWDVWLCLCLCLAGWLSGSLTHPYNWHSDVFASYTAKSTRETLWSWVNDYDELLLEMRAGHVFADFSEGPITFPPPFRWRVGKHAGDYTSVRFALDDPPAVFMLKDLTYKHHLTHQEERLRAAYVLRKKGDGERIPSYTVRLQSSLDCTTTITQFTRPSIYVNAQTGPHPLPLPARRAATAAAPSLPDV